MMFESDPAAGDRSESVGLIFTSGMRGLWIEGFWPFGIDEHDYAMLVKDVVI